MISGNGSFRIFGATFSTQDFQRNILKSASRFCDKHKYLGAYLEGGTKL